MDITKIQTVHRVILALFLATIVLCSWFKLLDLAQANDSSPQQPVIENTSNQSDGIEYKKIGDIDQRFSLVKDAKIEDIARSIAEVDEWFFTEKDEKPAREKIENELEKLRVQIENEIAKFLKEAIDAKKGKDAHAKISAVNSLLFFYPAPKTPDQRAKLEKITSSILDTSRRVEDIRRLRYNEWAISYIKGSLEYYRQESKIVGVDIANLRGVGSLAEAKEQIRSKYSEAKFTKNKEALVKACIDWMSPIDPAFLEPVVMDLYNYVYSLTRDAVGDNDDYRIRLTSGFANPKITRYTPSDF